MGLSAHKRILWVPAEAVHAGDVAVFDCDALSAVIEFDASRLVSYVPFALKSI